MHKQLKRIEDYQKTLRCIRTYIQQYNQKVQDKVILQLLLEHQDALIDAILEKEDGVILGIQVFIQKKVLIVSKILLTCMMQILILKK